MSKRVGAIWLAACLVLASIIGLRSSSGPRHPRLATEATAAVSAQAHATRAIEDIRVGQRVLGENPDLSESEHRNETVVAPATWRLVRLHAEGRWADGTFDTIEVETLQPLTWIVESGASIGRSVPIPCDLEELALPLDLHGTVVSIDPCPELEEGPGHLVLLTVNHLNNTVHDLVVTDAAGHRETINPTGIHRFYSDTRRDWVSAAELRIGEQVRGIDGALTVAHLAPRPGIDRVYNMTVEGQHVYHVSQAGALVHNAYLTPAQLAQNYQNGMSYQAQAMNALGATPNSTKYATSLGNTIPDGFTPNQLLEAKAQGYIWNSTQLQKEAELAGSLGLTPTLVVPNGTVVSTPVQDAGWQIINWP
jgi:hypothetical protein